jgi:hypothetical protein
LIYILDFPSKIVNTVYKPMEYAFFGLHETCKIEYLLDKFSEVTCYPKNSDDNDDN